MILLCPFGAQGLGPLFILGAILESDVSINLNEPRPPLSLSASHLDELEITETRGGVRHHPQVLDIAIDHFRAIGHVVDTTESQ